ncbi:MAG: hypothetical protein ACYCQI_07605 [Gammaproteobacteria bacterium]
MIASRKEKALDLSLNPYHCNASILVNHLLCTPSRSDNNIVIHNIDNKQSRVLKCSNIRKLVHLPGLGFASFSEYENGFILQIWQVNSSEITKLGRPRVFTGDKKKINHDSFFAVSPDSRYLAIKTNYTKVYPESYGSEHVAFTGLLIIDILKEKSYFTAVSEDIGIYGTFDRFDIVFTQSRQLALFHPKERWLSLYDLHTDKNEDIILIKRLEKKQISASNSVTSVLNITPSPNKKQWLVEKRFNSSASFYLLDPTNLTGKHKLALQHIDTQYFPYRSGRVSKVQWLDERIIMHVKHHSRDTIEIYDLEYHERLIIDIANLKDFAITEQGELFILKKNNEYELHKLPKSKVKQLLQQHPKTKETPFVHTLQDTFGINKLSRDLHFLIQDYAREPMHAIFFQPAMTNIKKRTASSARRLVDKKIKELQKRKSQIQLTLLNKNAELQSELKQIMIDSLVLHLLKNKISQSTIQDIKDLIEEALETGSAIQPVSFELLQFLDSIKVSLGSEIEIKWGTLPKLT